MKQQRLSAAVAILAGSAFILSACTPGDDGDNGDAEGTEENGAAENGEAGSADDPLIGEEGEYTAEGQPYIGEEPTDGGLAAMPEDFETAEDQITVSTGEVPYQNYNDSHSAANSVNTAVINARQTTPFMYVGADLSLNEGQELGTYEMIEEGESVYEEDEDGNTVVDEETGIPEIVEDESEPYVIEYSVDEDAVWSDGTPITVLDWQLEWASQAYASEEVEFSPAGASLATYLPNGYEADSHEDQTFTAEMPVFYADWEFLTEAPNQPAHIIADLAGLSTDELAEAIAEGDEEVLAEVAPVWNEGIATEGEFDPETALSAGPYVLSDWEWEGEESGGYVVLEANENWWGTPPGTSTLVFQFSDESTHVDALANYDYNVISPQADESVANDLRALAEDGEFIIHEGDTATWEHIDFQQEHGPFADNPELMEAIAYCLPRQEIVESIIQPVYEDAEVLDAREIFNYQEGYEEYVDQLDIPYGHEPDVDAASEIVEEAGAEGTDIPIHHFGQPRRHAVVELIDTYCGEDGAGFNIIDEGDAAFGAEVLDGEWSGLAMYAWSGSGQIVSGQNIYSSWGAQNAVGYDNPEVDELWATIGDDISDEERTDALIEMEQHLWDDLYSIPLYVHPGLDTADASIANVRHSAAQTQITWNAEQWQRVE